jgi:hypothetical protein
MTVGQLIERGLLAGWTPWLLDSLETNPAGFHTSVRQFSALIKPARAINAMR